MPRPVLFALLALFATFALAGCGKDPTLRLSAADHAEYPRPGNLDDVLAGTLHKAMLDCYRGESSEATGITVLRVSGSHGLLDIEVSSGSGHDVLDRCATSTVGGARMMREIGDTEGHIGFLLSAAFAQE